jgi:hypothetical protein
MKKTSHIYLAITILIIITSCSNPLEIDKTPISDGSITTAWSKPWLKQIF